MAGLWEVKRRPGAAPWAVGAPDNRTAEQMEADANEAAAATYNDFGGGLASAARGMTGSVKTYAASGLEELGAENFAQGLRASAVQDASRARALAPEIATTDQITDASTAVRYVLGKLGQGTGSIPPALVGGLAGRVLTRSGAGALAGSTAAYQPVMAGGHIQELDADPETAGMSNREKLLRGTGIGAAQAVVEGVGPAYLANRYFKHNVPATTPLGAVRNFGKEVGTGASLEGGGAAVSDVIGQAGMIGADSTNTYDPRQTFEAGVGEAIGGAGIAVPSAAISTGLDYVAAGGRAAVDAVGERAPGAMDAAGRAADFAKAGAQNMSDAAAMFKNTASGYMKHPELAQLVASQDFPPELEGANVEQINEWLAQDNTARNQAAINIARKTLIDREATESEKQAATDFLANPTDPESWKPFSEGLVAKHQIERLASKAAQVTSKVAAWADKARGKTKSNLERTPQDDEYFSAVRPTLAQASGIKDPAALDAMSAAVREFLLSTKTRDEAGWEHLPAELTEAFGERTPEVLAQAYDALRRQGLTRDIKTKQELTFYTPEVAKRVVAKQLAVQDEAQNIVHHFLTPTALKQATGGTKLRDITEAVRHYFREGKTDAGVEAELDQMFGEFKEEAVAKIAALENTPQSSLGRGPVDEASVVADTADMRGVGTEDAGSDKALDDYESGLTELVPNDDARYLFQGKKRQAFDTKNAFLDRHLDLARLELDPKGRELQYDKATKGDRLMLHRVGVMDYASETGDRKLLDELIAKHPELTHEEINQRFFVAKSTASEVDQGEAIDINPSDLGIPATTGTGKNERSNKASWQDRVRIDRAPKDGGNIDVSTLAHGRLYLGMNEFQTPFVTSSRKLIEKMWERKGRGAFDEKTAEKAGPEGMLAMFSAGLSSLLSAGVVEPGVDAGVFSGDMHIKLPDGKMQQVGVNDAITALPDEFVLWSSKDGKSDVTIGDAKAATSARVRGEKKSEMVVAHDDKGPLIYPTRRQAEAAAKKGQFVATHEESKGWAVYKEKQPAKERGAKEGAGPVERTRLQPEAKLKDDATEEAVLSARGLESRTTDVQGAPMTETEEMAAGNQKKFDDTERRFDEETGLELHPRGDKPNLKTIDRQAETLRTQYKGVLKELKRLEEVAGANAVRSGHIKKLRADLDAIVTKGKALAANRAELAEREAVVQAALGRADAAAKRRAPKFLQSDGTQPEATSLPSTDPRAPADIAKLAKALAAPDGTYEAATLSDHAALAQIAKAFGVTIRGFRVNGDAKQYGFFDGVFLKSNKDTVYLRDGSKRPHMALLGHELIHQMRQANPALYAKLESEITQRIKPVEYKAWSKMFNHDGKLTEDALREEFVAEVMSDGLMDRSFWNALSKKNLPLAKQLYGSVMRLLQKIMASVGYTPKTKSILNDYAEVMKVAGEVMAEHGAVRQFSLEITGTENATPEKMMEAEAYIKKTLGPQVAQVFTDQLKGSGEWSRDAKNQRATIRISTSALNPLSVAHHEAMHEFFQRLLDGKYDRAADVLRKAADSALVKRQLERHFAGQDAVLEQIENDIEERVAYMFQLWASGKLNIGPKTETVFRKIANVMRKVLGILSNDQKLEEIFQSFHDGKMAEPGAMAQVLNTQADRDAYIRRVAKVADPALKKANEWVGFAENALTGSKNPHLDWVGRQMNNKTGSKGDEQGFLSAKEQANNLYMNKFANALRGADPTGKDKRVASKEDVDLALKGLQAKTWHADPVIRRVQDQVVAVFKEMYKYMGDRGIKVFDPDTKKWDDVGEVKDYRIPVSWDPAKIIENSGKFKELLFEHHADALQAIADKANAEVAGGVDAGKYTASWERKQNGDKSLVTAEDIANALINRVISTNGQIELEENENALGFSPFAKSVNERTLSKWINHAAFAEFQEDDIVKIISGYVGQVTKRGEYSDRFGADGGILQEKMDAAWRFEIDQIKAERPDISDEDASAEAVDNLEPARKAIMAMEGTLGHDISAWARKASSYTIVYQNVRLLGYALFSNFVDPLGMMVRGGEFKDALAAFKRGTRDVFREWGKLTGLREEKDTDYDEATRVAEMIGTVDSSGFMSQMGTMYGSQYLSSWARDVNDTFFRWNGLESFNKAMRVQATQAAISFIKRHYEKPNEHSERYFEELGLSRDDVTIGPDGALNVDNRKVQQAVMRWVDGAILRPNAAIRPTMSSDPHYAVFYHLKQFMYAMHAIILKRVQVEIKNGNTSPLMLMMAGYVPVMLAADAAKGLIQEVTGGGAPYWQHGTMGDVLAHGVQRAGLLGVGQMVPDAFAHGPLDLAGPAVEQVADAVVDPLGKSVAEAVAVGPLSMLTKGPEVAAAAAEG